MSTLVVEHPVSVVASAQTSQPAVRRPDPFEGRPLARAVHLAGGPVLDSASVRRQEIQFKIESCRNYVRDQLKHPYPGTKPPSEEFLFRAAMAASNWEEVPVEYYRLLSDGGLSSAETAGAQAPSIPQEAEDVMAEISARCPGVIYKVRFYKQDPNIIGEYGKERICVFQF